MPSHYHQSGGLLSPSALPVPFDPRDAASRNPYDQLTGLLTKKAGEVAENPLSALIGVALQDPLMLADLSGATSSGRVKRESAGYGSLLGEPPIEVPGLPAGDISRQQLGIDNPAGMTGEMSPLSIGGMLKLAGKGLLSGGKAALGALGDGGGLLAHTLFHGTPHKFDRFALDKIGTGEGAQAYGHGLYFAENPGVAHSYKSRLSRAGHANSLTDQVHFLTVGDDRLIDKFPIEADRDFVNLINDGNQSGASRYAQERINRWTELRNDPEYQFRDYAAEKADAWSELKPEIDAGKVENPALGHLYEVDIHDEITDRMLDWDAPLSEQPEAVLRAIRSDPYLNKRVADAIDVFGERGGRGESIYTKLNDKMMQEGVPAKAAEEASSKWLNEAGIPGIRYFDGQSRVTGIPRKKVISNFLDELPEDAEFDEVMELVGTGHFSKAQDDVLRALDADDWLGFDHPSQAINEAFGPNLVSNFDPSPKLVKAISNTVEPDATRNIVVFNPDDITSVKRDGELVWENRLGIRPDDAGGVKPLGGVPTIVNRDEVSSGGYYGYSKSNRALLAENQGKLPITQAKKAVAEAAGITQKKAKEILERLGPTEWHHTSKNYNITDYYDVAAATDYANAIPLLDEMARQGDMVKRINEVGVLSHYDIVGTPLFRKLRENIPRASTYLGQEKNNPIITALSEKYGADSRTIKRIIDDDWKEYEEL